MAPAERAACRRCPSADDELVRAAQAERRKAGITVAVAHVERRSAARLGESAGVMGDVSRIRKRLEPCRATIKTITEFAERLECARGVVTVERLPERRALRVDEMPRIGKAGAKAKLAPYRAAIGAEMQVSLSPEDERLSTLKCERV